MDTFLLSGLFLLTRGFTVGIKLSSSSDKATLGADYTFTCETTINALKFNRFSIEECTIIGGYPNGTCKFYGSYNTNYKYDCNTNTGVYKLTIPSTFDINTLHGSNWTCAPALESGQSNTIQLNVNRIQLTSSSEKATIGVNFTFTCETLEKPLLFKRFSIEECTIIGGYPNGTCKFYGSYNTNYKYDCNTNTGVYKLTIPSTFDIDTLHGSNWTCAPALESGQSETIQLYVNVPITQVIITTSPTDRDQPITVVDTNHKFICRTNAGRPSSRIQWYISGTNVTGSANPQPDSCDSSCTDKVISSSELLYTGKKLDDGKIVYCTAVNVEGQSVRSENKSIVILYGASNVSISPSTLIYTVIEPTGSVGPISCIPDDCKPACTTKWSGPNLSDYYLSELNLQNIKRNQTGNYFCIVSNDAWSRTSVNISVIVNYGPILVTISPSTQNYNVAEIIGSVGPIHCTADCKPACTMTWIGPNVPEGTTTVLNLQNINRNQTGTYTCNATNNIGSHTSGKVDITVNYGPEYVIISPNQVNYTVNESNSIFPISCTSDCNPSCIITWSGPNISGEASSVLNLQNIDRSQTGIYMCTASNTVGSKISVGVNVVVNFRPTVDLFGHRTYDENNTVSLSCKIQSVPIAEIKWSFADRIIDSSFLVSVDNTSQVSTLTIRRAGCLSMGSYMCLAKNFIGEDNKAINIDIKCSPRINDFEYNISTSITVKDQASLNFTVPIIAYPMPNISWTHISSDTILNVTQKTSNVLLTNRVFSTLYIAHVTTADYGLYRIYAVNNIGKAENLIHSYEVIPKREPMPPFLYIVCKSTTATIIWKPGFSGDSSDRFYVMYSERGQKVITKQVDQNEREEPSVSTVTDLKPAMEYNFSIVAENQFGQSSSHTIICITDAACLLENVSEFKNNENTTMLGAGIGTLVVALLILAAGTIFVIRNNLRNKNTKPGISDEYTDIQRSNPTFTDDYSTIQSGNESRPLHEHSINTYEECGQTSAYQNTQTMKSGQEKTRKKQVIYDNMEI